MSRSRCSMIRRRVGRRPRRRRVSRRWPFPARGSGRPVVVLCSRQSFCLIFSPGFLGVCQTGEQLSPVVPDCCCLVAVAVLTEELPFVSVSKSPVAFANLLFRTGLRLALDRCLSFAALAAADLMLPPVVLVRVVRTLLAAARVSVLRFPSACANRSPCGSRTRSRFRESGRCLPRR